MYQFYCCDYLLLYSIYSILQCLFNSLCLLYISGSQSLVVISILFAKDTRQIHTVARCAQKKIVTAAKKDRELTQWTSLNDGLSPPS